MSDPCVDYPDDSMPPPGKTPFGPGSPFVPFYHPPRLGIIHLLAWTAATAVLLKFSLAVDLIGQADSPSLPPAWNVFQQATDFVYSTAHAAGLVGTGILLLAKVRGVPGRLQPGHWLALITTASALLYRSCRILYVLADSWDADSVSTIWIFGVYGLVGVSCAGMYFGAALLCQDARRWKIFFAALGAVALTMGLAYIAVSVFDLFGLLRFSSLRIWVVGAALLLTVVVDLRRGPQRDWLHWVGVAIVATGVMTSVAWWLWRWVAGPM